MPMTNTKSSISSVICPRSLADHRLTEVLWKQAIKVSCARENARRKENTKRKKLMEVKCASTRECSSPPPQFPRHIFFRVISRRHGNSCKHVLATVTGSVVMTTETLGCGRQQSARPRRRLCACQVETTSGLCSLLLMSCRRQTSWQSSATDTCTISVQLLHLRIIIQGGTPKMAHFL